MGSAQKAEAASIGHGSHQRGAADVRAQRSLHNARRQPQQPTPGRARGGGTRERRSHEQQQQPEGGEGQRGSAALVQVTTGPLHARRR